MTSAWRKDMFIVGGPFEKQDGVEYPAERPLPLKFGDTCKCCALYFIFYIYYLIPILTIILVV